MLRGVDVRAVVERVRVEGRLDAVVAVGPAARMHDAAAQRRKCVRELVALVVVDQVAALDHDARAQGAHGVGRACEDLCGQSLLRAEGRLERSSEAVEERDPGR